MKYIKFWEIKNNSNFTVNENFSVYSHSTWIYNYNDNLWTKHSYQHLDTPVTDFVKELQSQNIDTM